MASIADSLLACGAVKFGDFTLTSGAKSPYYIDVKAASTDPSTLKVIAHKMAQLAARNGPFDAVAGMELGGVPLATAVSLEANLPYALNFMAALSSAGVVPNEVFGALGSQEVYGEVAREAAWIHRDTKVFSKDLVSALQAAARRSPSQQFEEFLQGSLNTITSGGDLKTYFLAKSEQFTQDNRRRLKGFLESMGVMAESYVVVAAAAPLFLIVILSVMTLLSKTSDPTFLLNILVLLCMPVIHAMFAYILRTMRPD